ncbi:hypothetical protein E8E13_009386 [Curvularia kusanoi]|uniref:Uncharacterized protein n=1 Tax=Curvularia kusanoi TaxID=90978 RepID=A0A9P4TD20_CURKU|nr:hypothetical protein E8E13_009386 [Curvularia kusanoi]
MLNTTTIPAIFLTPPLPLPPLPPSAHHSPSPWDAPSLWPFPLLTFTSSNPTTWHCAAEYHVLLLRALLILVLLCTFATMLLPSFTESRGVSRFSAPRWVSGTRSHRTRSHHTPPRPPFSFLLQIEAELERVRPGLLGGGASIQNEKPNNTYNNAHNKTHNTTRGTEPSTREVAKAPGETNRASASASASVRVVESSNGPDIKDSCAVM